jgi:hypothetical protein
LSQAAAKPHTPFQQPQHWPAFIDAKVEGPSLLQSFRHGVNPLDVVDPVLAEPTIGMQDQQPGVL